MSLLAAACVDYAHLLRRRETPRCSFGAALGSRWIRSNVSGSLAVGVLRCLPCCRGYLAQPLPPQPDPAPRKEVAMRVSAAVVITSASLAARKEAVRSSLVTACMELAHPARRRRSWCLSWLWSCGGLCPLPLLELSGTLRPSLVPCVPVAPRIVAMTCAYSRAPRGRHAKAAPLHGCCKYARALQDRRPCPLALARGGARTLKTASLPPTCPHWWSPTLQCRRLQRGAW